jgi:hypothetical protein
MASAMTYQVTERDKSGKKSRIGNEGVWSAGDPA